MKVDNKLDWGEHIRGVTAKANSVLGMLKRAFVSRDVDLWKKLYVSLVRPHLEYAVQVWNPSKRKDVELIEKVQKRALRIPHELRTIKGYERRLEKIELTTLEVRRGRGDLIQA